MPEDGDAAAARAELGLDGAARARRLLRAPPPRGVPLGEEVVGGAAAGGDLSFIPDSERERSRPPYLGEEVVGLVGARLFEQTDIGDPFAVSLFAGP